MTPGQRRELLRQVFAAASRSQPVPPGPHVTDDDEQLTCWSLGQLPAEEQREVREHLARCPRCRQELAKLIRDGVLELPETATVPLRPRRRLRRWAGGALAAAVAAGLLVAVLTWGLAECGPRAELVRARQELDSGRAAAAFERVDGLLAANLDAAMHDEGVQLLERAAYETARTELTSGHFERVLEVERRVAERGAASARLLNLKLESEWGMPSEVALARAGMLLDYGYQLDGLAPGKALPDMDEKTDRLQREWPEAVRQHPQDAVLRANYGQFLLKQGRDAEAGEQFTAALRADPQSVAACLGLGLVAYKGEDYRAALGQFEAAWRLDGDGVAAHLNAAMCLERLERRVEAGEHWRRVRDATADPALRQRVEKYLAETSGRG